MAVAAAIVIVGAAAGIWVMLNDKGPVADNGTVAAEDARIEMTFTGDGTSYCGDWEVIEGTASLTMFNESTELLALLGYDPGSAEVAADPGRPEEGDSHFVGDVRPEAALAMAPGPIGMVFPNIHVASIGETNLALTLFLLLGWSITEGLERRLHTAERRG